MIVFLAVIVILAVTYVIGPTVKIDVTTYPVSLPEDLELYLSQTEQNADLTIRDVAKKIVWANPEKKDRTKISLIYLHGYTATLMETHPLTEMIAKKLNANIFYTRLKGHGETKERFAEATANDWLSDTLEAWEIGKRIGDEVIIIATSTGATLATWLALTQPVDQLKALIFISPNFWPADKTAPILLWPWGVQIAKLTTGGEYHPWEPLNEGQEKYWMCSPSIRTSAQVVGLADYVNSLDIKELKAPVLVLYSELDDVVSVPKIKEKFELMGSPLKRLVAVNSENNPSKHVLAGDIVGFHTTEFVREKIEEYLFSQNLIP